MFRVNQFFFIAIVLFSCKQEKKIKRIDNRPEKKVERKIRDTLINHADTIANKSIGKGFYKNSKGDIFEIKRTGYGQDGKDESLWVAYMFLDDEIKDSAWDNPGQLKEYIDIDTYTTDSLSSYSMDKGHVYWERATSDGPIRFVVAEADPKTFKGIEDRWGKDAKHIFYGGSIVKNADPKTFICIRGTWGKDAKFVFYEDKMVKSADPKTFYVYEGHYYDTARDKKYIYVNGERIK
jgi:hypothetical protein